jgi:hypothetical protein
MGEGIHEGRAGGGQSAGMSRPFVVVAAVLTGLLTGADLLIRGIVLWSAHIDCEEADYGGPDCPSWYRSAFDGGPGREALMAYGPPLAFSAVAVLLLYAWRRQVSWPAAVALVAVVATWPVLGPTLAA